MARYNQKNNVKKVLYIVLVLLLAVAVIGGSVSLVKKVQQQVHGKVLGFTIEHDYLTKDGAAYYYRLGRPSSGRGPMVFNYEFQFEKDENGTNLGLQTKQNQVYVKVVPGLSPIDSFVFQVDGMDVNYAAIRDLSAGFDIVIDQDHSVLLDPNRKQGEDIFKQSGTVRITQKGGSLKGVLEALYPGRIVTLPDTVDYSTFLYNAIVTGEDVGDEYSIYFYGCVYEQRLNRITFDTPAVLF